MPTVQPARYQLQRVKGWRKPENSVIVDRRTMWGNPFAVLGPYPKVELPFRVYCNSGKSAGVCIGAYKTKIEAAQVSVDLFSRYFDKTVVEPGTPIYIFRELYGWHGFQLACVCEKLLHGKSLGCWCRLDMPCHAGVILQRANP